jgi:Zn-dependent metalloprotease
LYDDTIISTIIGRFTTINVHSVKDAILVFKQVSPLLGIELNEFDSFFNADNITQMQTGGNSYHLKTWINGVPVLGGDIVLSVDINGVVRGLLR